MISQRTVSKQKTPIKNTPEQQKKRAKGSLFNTCTSNDLESDICDVTPMDQNRENEPPHDPGNINKVTDYVIYYLAGGGAEYTYRIHIFVSI